MGGEFAQRPEWTEAASLDWHFLQYDSHRGIQKLVADLNHLYASEPSLHQVEFDWHGFQWIDCHDADNSVFSFLRLGKNPRDLMVVVVNCTPVVRDAYGIGVPHPGFYQEILNTDSALYGGSNVGNRGGVAASSDPCHGHPFSLRVTLPPLAALFFKWHP